MLHGTEKSNSWLQLTSQYFETYINVVNAIASFVKPKSQTNIITNVTILTQYNMKQGLKIFGKKGWSAVLKEIQKFHYLRVIKLKKPQDLSYEQYRSSLAYLMFLKAKSDEVRSKGR